MYKFIIVFIVTLVTALHSAQVETNVTYTEDVQNVYGAGDLTMECPIVKDGYITRIHEVSYISGKTICKVYEINSETNIPNDVQVEQNPIVTNYNPSAKEHYRNLERSELEGIVNSQKIKYEGINASINSGEFINIYEQKYFIDYINTPGEYLTGSKYLLSGTMMNSDIIDFSASITDNSIILKNGYTIYPNHYQARDASIFENLSNWLGGFLDAVGIGSGNIDSKTNEILSEIQSINAHAEKLLDTIVLFIVHFMANSNSIYTEIVFIISLLAVAGSILFIVVPNSVRMVSNIFKEKDNQVRYEEFNVIEKMVFSGLLFMVFFVGFQNIRIDTDTEIDQTNFQSFSGGLLYQGVEYADILTQKLVSSYLNFKLKDAGLISGLRELELKKEEKVLINIINANGDFYTEKCLENYDITKIKELHNLKGTENLNIIFPTPDSIQATDNALLKDDVLESIKTDEDGEITKEIPTFNACATAYYSIAKDHRRLKDVQNKLEDRANLLGASDITKQVKLMVNLSESLFKATADYGFLAAPMVGASEIFLDASEVMTTKNIAAIEDRNREVNSISEDAKNGMIDDLVEFSTENMAYMMIPGASSIRESIYGFYEFFTENGGEISSFFSGYMKVFDGLEKTASLVMAIIITKSFVDYLPILTLTISTFLVIAFYYGTVFIFYLVSPFLLVYAMATSSTRVIQTFLGKFLVLMVKPVIIVISVVIALFIINLLNGLYGAIVQPTFEMINALLNSDGSPNLIDSPVIFFLKALAKLFLQVGIVYIVWQIIFNGEKLILSIFGYHERGTDIGETVGMDVESGANRYTRPI